MASSGAPDRRWVLAGCGGAGKTTFPRRLAGILATAIERFGGHLRVFRFEGDSDADATLRAAGRV